MRVGDLVRVRDRAPFWNWTGSFENVRQLCTGVLTRVSGIHLGQMTAGWDDFIFVLLPGLSYIVVVSKNNVEPDV